MNKSLSAGEGAELVLKQMTLDEKLVLLHGNGMANNPTWTMPLTSGANGGAGYVEGIKRLGIPPLVISDAAYGVRDSGVNGRYATAMPSNVGAASGVGPAIGLRIRRGDWSRAQGSGIQYDVGRRRESYS